METTEKKIHWENIYKTKNLPDVSWFEAVPKISLGFIETCKVPLNSKIIDIGGGDSYFVDHLIKLGFKDITVLDISETALEKAKKRLGNKAGRVKWIAADATTFKPTEKYDFWHDRAAFHFLTKKNEINSYVETVEKNLNPNGILVLGTFSKKGPEKCSGLRVKQYSANTLTTRFKNIFTKIKCVNFDHITPFNTNQNFVFCSFRKLA